MLVVKKGITHQRVDLLLRLINGEDCLDVPNGLPVYLFNMEMVPKWSKDIVPMLIVGKIFTYLI